MLIPIVAYVALCVVCGLVAQQTRVGFLGGFVIAALVTPPVCLAVLLVAMWIAGGRQPSQTS